MYFENGRWSFDSFLRFSSYEISPLIFFRGDFFMLFLEVVFIVFFREGYSIVYKASLSVTLGLAPPSLSLSGSS